MSAFNLIGTIIFAGFFIMKGLNHFTNLKPLSAYAKSKNLPAPESAVLLSGFMLLFGGLSILLNMGKDLGILLLVIFLVATNFIMHQFWTIKDPAHRSAEQIGFMANMAIIGALLIMM